MVHQSRRKTNSILDSLVASNPSRRLEQSAIDFGLDGSPLEAIKEYIQAGLRAGGGSKDLLNFFLKSRSTLESRWSEEGVYVLGQAGVLTGELIFQGYEWFSFKLPGGSYTPDFNYLTRGPGGGAAWTHVEVKASTQQAGYTDARAKMRGAATLNPWFTFIMVLWDKKTGWSIETLKPDLDYVLNLKAKLDE